MKKIYFATTNQNKIDEAKSILGVNIEGVGLEDIYEIQSLDPVEVTVHKANQYYKKLKMPIIVEDTFIALKALNGLPGAYFKDFYKALGNQGFADLLKGKKDRSALAQTTVVYFDEKGNEHVFWGRMKGAITTKPIGEKGFGWDPIFKPSGETKTLGQMELDEKNKYSMRAKAFKKLKKFLES